MHDEEDKTDKLMRVGELAKAVGKTVRAMHLYEELGLREPRARSEGGFRLYGPEAVDRTHWLVKLQAIGFTLAEIQGFVKDFASSGTGREATARVCQMFSEKQAQIREQMVQLQVIENDLSEAVAYLDSCRTCTDDHAPAACGGCDHHGHQKDHAPGLFAGVVGRPSRCDSASSARESVKEFDVPVSGLNREGN